MLIKEHEEIKIQGNSSNDLVKISDAGVTIEGILHKDGRITGLSNPIASDEPATKGYVDQFTQGLDWQESVLDKDLTTPPTNPNVGDRYLILSGDNGTNWEGHNNEIAEWDGSAWQFSVPDKGTTVYVEDENRHYTYNGTTWVIMINLFQGSSPATFDVVNTTQVTNVSLTGCNINNTDYGTLYGKIKLYYPGHPQYQVYLYKDSARTQLVASGVIDYNSDGTVTLNEANSSGISGTCDIHYTSDASDWYIENCVDTYGIGEIDGDDLYGDKLLINSLSNQTIHGYIQSLLNSDWHAKGDIYIEEGNAIKAHGVQGYYADIIKMINSSSYYDDELTIGKGFTSFGQAITLWMGTNNGSVRAIWIPYLVENALGSTDKIGVYLTPNLEADDDNETLTALHINPTFNDNGLTGISLYGLIVQRGNSGFGTTTPDATLAVSGDTHFDGVAYFTLQTLTSTGNDTIDWNNGNKAKITLTQDETLAFTAPAGSCSLQLIVKQDETGGRTITWPSNVKWAGGTAPTLSTGANAVDVISFLYDEEDDVYYGTADLNFS